MPVKKIDGKALAESIKELVKLSATKLDNPTLAVVLATKDESAHYYSRHIKKSGEACGIKVNEINLSADATQDEITHALLKLANDKHTHGIILQTPLPDSLSTSEVNLLRLLIPPSKDIDCANPVTAGELFCGMSAFTPSTAAAVMHILQESRIDLSGKHAVVVGRSLVVGKPLSYLLLDQDATVTICHSKTKDLKSISQRADVLIVAVGQPKMIDKNYVKPGAIVIDVGTNVNDNGKLVGDVDAESIKDLVGAYTPVPGGVGPVTTALVLQQTVQAAQTTTKHAS